MQIVIEFIKANKNYLIAAGFAILIFIIGFLIYDKMTTHTTTMESQTEAESLDGIHKAADRAKVPLDNDQAKTITKEIERIREEKIQPMYVTKTVVKEVEKTVDKERERNGADFSVVTDPKHPDEKVDLSKYDKDQKVELNQYNIQAYKKVIRTVEYNPSEKELGFSIQKKISKNGVYAGIGIAHDIDDNKTSVKYMVSW